MLFESLFKDKVSMDKHGIDDMGAKSADVHEDSSGWWIGGQEYVSLELERMARSIRNMLVRTVGEWKEVHGKLKCPRCGAKNWDID